MIGTKNKNPVDPKKNKKRLLDIFKKIRKNKHSKRIIIVASGLSLSKKELSKVTGVSYYEERLFFYISLLRRKNTTLIFLCSYKIDPVIFNYYFDTFFPNKKAKEDAIRRFFMLSPTKYNPKLNLTKNVLTDSKLIKKIEQIKGSKKGYLVCFNSTRDEELLASAIKTPLFYAPYSLLHLGEKSGSRKIFKEAGVNLPYGFEDLHTQDNIAEAIINIKNKKPDLRKVIVKFNDSFSGVGNATLILNKIKLEKKAIKKHLKEKLKLVDDSISIDEFLKDFRKNGGIVEEWIDGKSKSCPSVRVHIDPKDGCQIKSTQEQIFGDKDGQLFIGCLFPADEKYRKELFKVGKKVGKVLMSKGIIRDFSIDCLAFKEKGGYKIVAVEINLRKGGSTHPFEITRRITRGKYSKRDGNIYVDNQKKYYYANDNFKKDTQKYMNAAATIHFAKSRGFTFQQKSKTGIFPYLLSPLREYGKMGLLSIANSPKKAKENYQKFIKEFNSYIKKRNKLKVLLLQIRTDTEGIELEYRSILSASGLSPEQIVTKNLFKMKRIDKRILKGYDAIIIGGSSDYFVSDDLHFLEGLKKLVKHCYDVDFPTLGICFGFEVMIIAFGGTVADIAECSELGSREVTKTKAAGKDPIFADISSTFYAQLGHRDSATGLPKGSIKLAYSKACPYQAFTFKNKLFYGFQFHPESNKEEFIGRMIPVANKYHVKKRRQLEKIIKNMKASPQAATIIAKFIDLLLK